MTDFLICSIPSLSIDRIPGAPALLKAAVIESGYTAQSVDFSLEFFINQCNRNIDKLNALSDIFRPYENFDEHSLQAVNEWTTDSINYIKSINPTLVGISVFSVFQHRSAYLLAKAIREQCPNIKIVLGGFGLIVHSNSLDNFAKIRRIELIKPYHQFMLDHKLCDYAILENGVSRIIDIIEEVVGPIKNDKRLEYFESTTLFKSPIPNYDEYKIDEYIWNEDRSLPITGSKGCVRSCVFCDIPGQFGRFRYRTGEDIATEMVYLNQRHGIKIFEFTDSLVNGSNKAFKEWMTVVAEYNDKQTDDNKIRWFGHYICKPQSTQPAGIYELMARSGATNLIFGVESGSDAILEAMKKKITIKDVFDELEQLEKYRIKCTILMLSGFYNETWLRFLETLDFISKISKYVASGIIANMSFGTPLYINDQMHLHDAAHELGIIVDELNDLNWTIADDPSNDFVERSRRRLIVQLLQDKLGIAHNYNSALNMQKVYSMLKNTEKELIDKLDQLTKLEVAV
jgi:radical SAM superfamily enzyme YgiQ (UPF0313 family)